MERKRVGETNREDEMRRDKAGQSNWKREGDGESGREEKRK